MYMLLGTPNTPDASYGMRTRTTEIPMDNLIFILKTGQRFFKSVDSSLLILLSFVLAFGFIANIVQVFSIYRPCHFNWEIM